MPNTKMISITKEDILNYLELNKTDIKNRFGVIKIGLFGSFARGEQKADSDIDIAIEIEKDKKNIHNFFAFKRELERVFGRDVDLGIESTLKPFVKDYIKDEIIYA